MNKTNLRNFTRIGAVPFGQVACNTRFNLYRWPRSLLHTIPDVELMPTANTSKEYRIEASLQSTNGDPANLAASPFADCNAYAALDNKAA